MSESEAAPRRRREDDVPVSRVSSVANCLPLMPADVVARLSTDERSAFFCTLVDAVLDAIIAHRSDGTIVYANRGANEMLGYEAEDILSIDPWGWVSPDSIASAPKRIETILHDGRLAFVGGCRRKDGSVFATEVASRRVDTSIGPIIVSVIRDVSQRTEAERRLEFLAFHDALTGLGNRSRLDDRLSMAIADAKRHGDLLGMGYIDLDKFKPINDRYGHAVGDDVLIEVGRRLRDDVREQDAVSRLGGDEFVILLPRLASAGELPAVAKRVIASIEQPIFAAGHELHIKAAVGLAMFDPERDDARSFLVKADVAMYAAKQDPDHPWLVYDERMASIERRTTP